MTSLRQEDESPARGNAKAVPEAEIYWLPDKVPCVVTGTVTGLPELPDDDVLVDTAGAAALVRVNPKTITGRLARSGPKKQPFPSPHRLLYATCLAHHPPRMGAPRARHTRPAPANGAPSISEPERPRRRLSRPFGRNAVIDSWPRPYRPAERSAAGA